MLHHFDYGLPAAGAASTALGKKGMPLARPPAEKNKGTRCGNRVLAE